MFSIFRRSVLAFFVCISFFPVLRGLDAQVIDTRTAERRGVVSTPGFGQTFTVPDGATTLLHFSFFLATSGNMTASMSTYEAFIMQWNGTAAVGDVLYSSGERTASPCCPVWEENFLTGNLPVTAGTQYVAVVWSYSGNLVHSAAALDGDYVNSYSGGSSLFPHSCEDVLIGCGWVTQAGQDKEFVATFTSVATVPEPAPFALFAAGGLVAFAARRIRLRQT